MKQQNFVTAAMQPVQHSIQSVDTVRTKRTFNLFGAVANLYTTYTEWTARRNRVKICRQVAELFRTDMESAGTLLYLFRDMTLWIDGDPNEERRKLFAYLAGETERPQIEQREPPVHPAWTKEQLAERAPMINDYTEAFSPEPHAVAKLAQTLNMAQLERPKSQQPKNTETDKMLEILMEFVLDLYDSLDTDKPLVKADGYLLRTTKVPWSQRGVDKAGNTVSTPIKRRMEEVVTANSIFIYDANTTIWRLNLEEYPDYESVCEVAEYIRNN